MTTTQFILVIAVMVAVASALIFGIRRAPRITQITRTVRKDDDKPKGGPDA